MFVAVGYQIIIESGFTLISLITINLKGVFHGNRQEVCLFVYTILATFVSVSRLHV